MNQKIARKEPLVIAHRGYSSLFPENTMESIEAALYKSDLAQFDVLLTKDHQVIIFHDRYLSNLTNIAQFSKFQSRKRVATFDIQPNEKERDDWWVKDFTLEELQELSVKQTFPQRPQLSRLSFKIPTLQDALREVLKIKNKTLLQNRCGFLIEIKTVWQQKEDEWDDILVRKLISILQQFDLTGEQKCEEKRFPIVIQSFSHRILQMVSRSRLTLPIVHLFEKGEVITEQLIKQRRVENMIGIGISQAHATAQMRELCNGNNLIMYYWTLRDDYPREIPFQLSTYKQVYFYLLRLGINGFITQFPEKCQEYIHQFSRIDSH